MFFLAYTIDDKVEDDVTIPAGTRTQSIPGPDELPQTFETSENLKARAEWNNLRPRMTRPQTRDSIEAGNGENQHVYLKGVSTNLESNDPLLIDFGDEEVFFRVKEVVPDAAMDRTLVKLQAEATLQPEAEGDGPENNELFDFSKTIKELTLPPSDQVPNSLRLSRKIKEQFGGRAESSFKALSTLARLPQNTLAAAMSNAKVTDPTDSTKIKVYALRSKAHLFGHNYPGHPVFSKVSSDEFTIPFPAHISVPIQDFWPEELTEFEPIEGLKKIVLEPQNEQLAKDSWVVIERPVFSLSSLCDLNTNEPTKHIVCQVNEIDQSTLHGGLPEYLEEILRDANRDVDILEVHSGFSSKVDVLTLKSAWLSTDEVDVLGCMRLLNDTVVYTQSEELYLAEEPMGPEICQKKPIEQKPIELDGYYEGLEPGRWVIVSGERAIEGTSGVRSSELAMLASVTHGVSDEALPDDKTHTFINPI